MAYFYSVVTTKPQDRLEGAVSEHAGKLNAYIASAGANGKDRDIKHMNTTQVINYQDVTITTILCCDEDEDD